MTLKPLGPKSGTYDPPTDQLYEPRHKYAIEEFIKENKNNLDPNIDKWVKIFEKLLKDI